MLFLVGGPSQIDTWDPKPNAPAEVRGPFKPIATNVPGMQISEIFPKMAKHADKFSLIRSVYHTATAVHDTGHQMMQTGRLFTGGIEHPHAGCVLGYLKGQRGEVPAHVLLPRPIGRTGGNLPHGQTAGYLGKQHDPFVLNADPSDPKFKVPDLLPPDYISAVRAERRQKMRDAVDGDLAAFEKSAQAKQLDDNFNLAYRLMSSPQAREAFALDKEPDADARPLRPDALRPELPAGPPADRARRALRHGQHVRDGLRRDHLGHPRLAAVHRHRRDGPAGGAELRPGVQHPAGRPEGPRPAVERRW